LAAGLLVAGLAWAADGPKVSAQDALKMLQDGNARFVAGKGEHPRADEARRVETARNGQQPFAAILACADSREALEIVFDQGIGDLFTIRVAGNVSGTDQVASVEYGTEHLGTPLLLVLGHSKCGAVTAVVKGDALHGSLPALGARIAPAVEKVKAAHPDADPASLVPAAIEANVWQSMDDLLRRSPIVRKLVQEGKLKPIGAVHDIESGQVKWLGEPPNLAEMLKYTGGPADHAEGAGGGHAVGAAEKSQEAAAPPSTASWGMVIGSSVGLALGVPLATFLTGRLRRR
jgi:carbonic anhydrase